MGKEGEGHAIYDEQAKRLIHLPMEAKFLRMALKQTGESWGTLTIRGFAKTDRRVFFYGGQKWHHAEAGDYIWGYVLGRELEVEMLGATTQ